MSNELKIPPKKCFWETTALDLTSGLSVLNSEEAEVKKAMISSSQEIICLADYSKFHHVAFAPFCSMEKINTLITDNRIPPEEKDLLQQRDIRIHVV